MTTPADAKDPKTWMIGLLIALVLIWVLVGALPFLSLALFPQVSDDYHKSLVDVLGQWSAFGDMFNILSALLTAAALCGVVYTAILQRQQITMQMRELEETRKQTELAEKAAQIAREERDVFQKEARDRQIVALRETILSATIAIANATSQLSTGKITPGKREAYEREAEKWLRRIEASLQADEAALTAVMRN